MDTGSSVTIISNKRYNQIKERHWQLEAVNFDIALADGSSIRPMGKLQADLCFAGQTVSQEVLVADVSTEGILGLDFMRKHDCQLHLSGSRIRIAGKWTNLNTERDKPQACRITLAQTVCIPAGSELVISGKIEDGHSQDFLGMVEPSGDFTTRHEVLLGRTLVEKNVDVVPIRVLNPTTLPKLMYKGTSVGNLQPVDVNEERVLKGRCAGLGTGSEEDERDIIIPEHLRDLIQRSTEHVDQDQKFQITKLLCKYQDVFARDDDDLGRTDLTKHTINTGNAQPIRQPALRVPLHLRSEADQQVEDMLKRGVIEPSHGPWAAPVVLVKKKDGSTRFCVDYRKLNAVTLKDAYPIPRINDSLDSLSGAAWFSTLDLASGYWQVEVDPKDQSKTAFSTRNGLYQFRVMPFGLCNAPSTFERLMEMVLSGLQWQICLVYLDDIIIFGRTIDEELERLQQVLERIRKTGMKLKPKKCFLFQKKVLYLGHIVSADGIATNPEKIESVKHCPIPVNVKQVRSFLGLCSYYRRFIKDFAKVADPLHRLTEKQRPFNWTEDCTQSFQRLKTFLTTAPILAYPRDSGKFILDTDASNTGIGAVLSQEQDGEERVIAYSSRSLSKAERRYCVTRKELLAVVHFIKYNRHYLYGKRFLLRTDHGALRWLCNFKEPEGQLARWLEVLGTYDFNIQHRPGRQHGNADALSRLPCLQCGRLESGEDMAEQDDVDVYTPDYQRDYLDELIGQESEEDVPTDGNSSPKPDSTSPVKKDVPTDGNLSSRPDSTSPVGQEEEVPTDNDLSSRPDSTSPVGQEEEVPTDNDLSSIPDSKSPVKQEEVCNDTGTVLPLEHEQTAGSNPRLTAIHRVPSRPWLQQWTPQQLRALQRDDADLAPIIGHLIRDTSPPPWSEISNASVRTKILWARWTQLTLDQGIMYYQQRLPNDTLRMQLVVPGRLRREIFQQLHSSLTAGHLGRNKTTRRIKERFWWPKVKGDVDLWCKCCDQCASRKMPPGKRKAPLRQYQVGMPLERVAMDVIGPLQETERGNKYILVIGDYFSKWKEGYAMPNQEAETVADHFVREFICRFGVPYQLHTDQGRNFESELFQQMCSRLGIEKTRTTPGRPESDGMVERFNRTLEAMLSMFVSENQRDWDEFLPMLMMAYRSTPHDSTKYSPNMLMMGRESSLPIDVIMGIPREETEANWPNYVERLQQKMEMAHRSARENLKKSAVRQKRNYDQRAEHRQFAIGDPVWFYNPVRKKGICPKLQMKWTGPFTVIDKLNNVVYKIQLAPKTKPKVIHMDRLKEYRGENRPTWWKLVKSTHRHQPQREGISPEDTPVSSNRTNDGAGFETEWSDLPRRSQRIRNPPRRWVPDC